jgi:hypothetical protein
MNHYTLESIWTADELAKKRAELSRSVADYTYILSNAPTDDSFNELFTQARACLAWSRKELLAVELALAHRAPPEAA